MPGTEPADVDAVTGAVLTASRLLVAISARSISSVAETITLPQFRLLVVLHNHGPLKQAALAGHLGVNPSTASRMVDRLSTGGMIERKTSPASRREFVVTLTTDGSAVVEQVTSRRREEIARIVAAMPESTRAGLVDALTAFTDAGEEPRVS